MMSQEERSRLAEYWLNLAVMYGKDIPRPTLRLMVDAVCDLGFGPIMGALEKWAKTPGKHSYPLPGDIRGILMPEIDLKAVAVALARKIDNCVSKHGWAWDQGVFSEDTMIFMGGDRPHATFKEAVIAELGPIGWEIIRQKGGWASTCRSANEMEEGMFIAQTRDLVHATLQLESQGVNLQQLGMPTKENLQGPDRVQQLLGSIKKLE
jgi:hypothetical protein